MLSFKIYFGKPISFLPSFNNNNNNKENIKAERFYKGKYTIKSQQKYL